VTRIVIDPGHRGAELALDVALRVRDRAPGLVRLTRSDQRGMPLPDRIRVARDEGASTFLSIQAGSGPAAEVWVHSRASIASRLLGGRTMTALAVATGAPARPPREAALVVLDPDLHAAGCATSLIELGSASYPCHRTRLGGDHPGELADAISRAVLVDRGAVTRPAHVATGGDWFDVWHEVPMVEQLTGMSCWAAAAAMIVGWRGCFAIESEEVAVGAGRWHAYRDGLEPRDVEAFARTWGLVVARPVEMSVAEIRQLLETYGPLWVGEASPGLHVIVLTGMYGDATPHGTFVRIADPWPIGSGERYTIPFAEFRRSLLAAAALARGRPQLLHAAPGARCGDVR
jgi:hypothetical protein